MRSLKKKENRYFFITPSLASSLDVFFCFEVFFGGYSDIPYGVCEMAQICNIPDTGSIVPSMCQFCCIGKDVFLYSVFSTATSVQAVQVCRVQTLCNAIVFNVALWLVFYDTGLLVNAV